METKIILDYLWMATQTQVMTNNRRFSYPIVYWSKCRKNSLLQNIVLHDGKDVWLHSKIWMYFAFPGGLCLHGFPSEIWIWLHSEYLVLAFQKVPYFYKLEHFDAMNVQQCGLYIMVSWKNAQGHIELPCYFNPFLSIQLTYYFNYIITLTFSLSFDLLILESRKTRLN